MQLLSRIAIVATIGSSGLVASFPAFAQSAQPPTQPPTVLPEMQVAPAPPPSTTPSTPPPSATALPAQPVPLVSPAPNSPQRESGGEPPARWYGRQTLICDGLGLGFAAIGGLIFAAAPGRSGDIPGIASIVVAGSLISYGAPIVHWVHGYVGRGFASLFLLRGLLPGAASLLGFGIASAATNSATVHLSVTSIFSGVGLLVGMGLDAGWLAYDDAPSFSVTTPPVDPATRARLQRWQQRRVSVWF